MAIVATIDFGRYADRHTGRDNTIVDYMRSRQEKVMELNAR